MTVTEMINSLHAAQHVGHQITALEACRILPMGHLVVCRSVDIIKNRTWQPSSGELPEIMKVVTVAQAHIAFRPSISSTYTRRGGRVRA